MGYNRCDPKYGSGIYEFFWLRCILGLSYWDGLFLFVAGVEIPKSKKLKNFFSKTKNVLVKFYNVGVG